MSALTLKSPSLSCSFALMSNAGPSPVLSYSASAAWCPVLLLLLWVRVSLQNHLPLCRGTQPLGDLCKADSLFSLSRPRHILDLLSASSTPVLADHVGSPFFGIFHLHRWPLAPGSLLRSMSPALGSLGSIFICPSVCSWSRQPIRPTWECPFRSIFLTWLTDTGLDLLPVSFSKVILRSFWEKGSSVCSSDDACSECPVIYLATLGDKQLVYQSWPGCSPPGIIRTCMPKDRPLLLGNMFWETNKKTNRGQVKGCYGAHMRSHCWGHCLTVQCLCDMALFSVIVPYCISFPSLHWLLESLVPILRVASGIEWICMDFYNLTHQSILCLHL